jgi:hypothetical protein
MINVGPTSPAATGHDDPDADPNDHQADIRHNLETDESPIQLSCHHLQSQVRAWRRRATAPGSGADTSVSPWFSAAAASAIATATPANASAAMAVPKSASPGIALTPASARFSPFLMHQPPQALAVNLSLHPGFAMPPVTTVTATTTSTSAAAAAVVDLMPIDERWLPEGELSSSAALTACSFSSSAAGGSQLAIVQRAPGPTQVVGRHERAQSFFEIDEPKAVSISACGLPTSISEVCHSRCTFCFPCPCSSCSFRGYDC